jgi:hypothetical protein
MNLLMSIYLTMFLILPSMATIYEDAEDARTERWEKVDTVSQSVVYNIVDEKKNSRIIKFQGEETQTAYVLKVPDLAKKKDQKEYFLSWEMQYSEDFVIIVTVETTKGRKYLVYIPGIFQNEMLFGLGLNASNGEWHSYERNLQKDLNYYDNRCTILSLSSFVIRGSGRIDNIKSTFANVSKKRVFNSLFYTQETDKKNNLPEIIIEGENPLHLAIGDSFIEPGVSAHDTEDGELLVTTIESIDSMEEGQYSVMYMTKDNEGDSAMAIRHIVVGDVSVREKETMVLESKLEQAKQEEKKLRMDEREYEMEAWERELFLREKALKKELHREKEFLKKE